MSRVCKNVKVQAMCVEAARVLFLCLTAALVSSMVTVCIPDCMLVQMVHLRECVCLFYGQLLNKSEGDLVLWCDRVH